MKQRMLPIMESKMAIIRKGLKFFITQSRAKDRITQYERPIVIVTALISGMNFGAGTEIKKGIRVV
jgi:hypothetical protein